MPKTKGRRALAVVLLLGLMVGGLYWFFLRDQDPAAEQLQVPTTSATNVANLPEEATDCGNGVAVTGKWGCAFGTAVSAALGELPADLKTQGADVSVRQVHDAVTDMNFDIVCRMDDPIVCLWSEHDKVYVNVA